MEESLTSDLKKHLAEEHKIVEAYDGIVVSDDVIVYGAKRDPGLIVTIHKMDHDRGAMVGHSHYH